MSLILNDAQSEAIVNAMSYLNNVSGRIKVEFGNMVNGGVNVWENAKQEIHVVQVENYTIVNQEIYYSQAEFAEAYGWS